MPSEHLPAPVSGEDHVRGDPHAKIELVMYGDFGCDASAAAHQAITRLAAQHPGRLAVCFRHFPRSAGGSGARPTLAAEAAEAAGAQGAFWEMHDRLFELGGDHSESDLAAHAYALGLDADRFKAELHSRVHAARVQRDAEPAAAAGIAVTPEIYIDGRRHTFDADRRSLAAALEAAS